MVHYVCAGECGGTSELPGLCRADACSLKGVQLTECSCDDGMHEKMHASDNLPKKQ